jgi:AraC family transcriptional regulator
LRTSRKILGRTVTTYTERVNRAIDYVVSHLGEPVWLADVSRAAGMSPFHFHRVFQALVGVTVADFVKRQRLDKALFMMSHSRRYSLTQIALACGFPSSSDFSRSFKQRFGVAPSRFDLERWRDEHRSKLHAAAAAGEFAAQPHLEVLPAAHNPDRFKVKIRALPARTVAYIRVSDPYRPGAVVDATKRLVAWSERHALADGQWLGYQWAGDRSPGRLPIPRGGRSRGRSRRRGQAIHSRRRRRPVQRSADDGRAG